ncbi:MAG TPA: hypothetical protein PLU79_12375, partial [Burkholderiaceae bacterium]|nr:hypothetical protein [Burkholderiaceae bacterium]
VGVPFITLAGFPRECTVPVPKGFGHIVFCKGCDKTNCIDRISPAVAGAPRRRIGRRRIFRILQFSEVFRGGCVAQESDDAAVSKAVQPVMRQS